MPSLKTPAPKPQWATLQAMAIRYQALVDGPLDDPERVALRAQIASHLMGGVVRCLVSDDEPDADAPAPL
ncbi:MAG: hypothetical protein U5L74_03285 [Ideonella sp.]|nr:hypothetical protein [Ideonella sp.]